jgi:hypothetical protein
MVSPSIHIVKGDRKSRNASTVSVNENSEH